MNYCTHCGAPVTDQQPKFCSACGNSLYGTEHQPLPKKTSVNAAALVTLCILTILGSVLGIIKGLFVEAFYSEIRSFTDSAKIPLGYASALFNMGTLVGAVYMLNRKKWGYTVYMIAQSAAILTAIYWLVRGDRFLNASEFFHPLLLLTSSVTIVPSLLFMALYTFMVRKELH